MLESSQGVKGECLRLKEEVDRLKAAVENPYSVSYHPGPRLNGKVNGHVTYSTSPPTSSSDSPFPPDPKADERNKEYLLSMDVDKVWLCVYVQGMAVCMCARYGCVYVCKVWLCVSVQGMAVCICARYGCVYMCKVWLCVQVYFMHSHFN